MQASANNTGRRFAKACGFALLALPVLMAGGCPMLVVSIGNCPTELASNATETLTLSAADMDGNAVTATFTVEQTAGSGDLMITTNGTMATVAGNDAAVGSYTVRATGMSDMNGNGTAECTFDVVEPAPCTTDADCDDGDVCNGMETCNTTTGCVAGTALNCDDGMDCTDDACDATAGCSNTNNCPDGQLCTADGCAACAVDADCDDGDACTVDVCTDGACDNSGVTDCDDGLDCTDDSCDSATGCANVSNCDAATPICTADGCVECETDADCMGDDTCVANVCTPTGTPCTTDADCDDGVFCNGAETCGDDMLCSAGDPPCDESQDCNEDDETCEDVVEGTFDLTDGVDNFVGTAGVNLFRGVVATTNGTLTPGDVLDGGGGRDRLNVTQVDANYSPVATILRIERIFVRNVDVGNARTFNVAGIDAAEELWSMNSLASVEFTSIDHLVAIGVQDTDQDITATFNNSVFTGSDDTVTVVLDGTDWDDDDGVDIVIRSSGADGPETVEIQTCGQDELIDSLLDDGENDFDTLLLNNMDPLTIRALDGTFDTIDASGAGAGIDIELPGDDNTVTGSPFDDIFRVAATSADLTIDGGDGDDSLISEAGIQGTLTSIETATVENSATTLTLDLDNAQDFMRIDVNNTAAGLATFTITNLPDGFTLGVDSDTNFTVSNNSSFSLHADVEDGSSNTLNLEFTGNASAISFTGALDTGELEQIFVHSDVQGLTLNVANVFDRGNDDTLEMATFTGTGNITIGNTLADSASLVEVDATGVTGNFTQSAAVNDGTEDIEINSGTGNDTLTGGAGDDILNGAGGNDTINGAAGDDSIDGDTGNDTLNGGAGDDDISGGSGNDTIDGGDDDDTIDGGNGNDTIEGGEGADDISPGEGSDTIVYDGDHADSTDVDDVEFTAGAGGDIFDINVTACGGIIAAFTANYIEGSAASAADNSVHVITDTGYANFTAAETAIEAGNANTDDYVVIFLNTTNNVVEGWADADSGVAGSGCHLFSINNITTLSGLANFVSTNITN